MNTGTHCLHCMFGVMCVEIYKCVLSYKRYNISTPRHRGRSLANLSTSIEHARTSRLIVIWYLMRQLLNKTSRKKVSRNEKASAVQSRSSPHMQGWYETCKLGHQFLFMQNTPVASQPRLVTYYK